MQVENKEPISKFSTFVANDGRTILIGATIIVIGYICTTWLQNVHFLNFNWVAVMQIVITALLAWFYFRTTRKLKRDHQANIVALRNVQVEQLKQVKTDCEQRIADAEARLMGIIKNEETQWSTWKVTHEFTHHQNNGVFVKELNELKEHLKDKQPIISYEMEPEETIIKWD